MSASMSQKLENYLTLTINGEAQTLRGVSPTMTLLEFLRRSGRVGTKEGCGDGDCGACTVAIIGEGADGEKHYQAVNSCLIPLGAVADREVITVEGISNGELHPVQAAMVKTGGSQCGYCTPGFIMSMFAAYYNGAVDDSSIEGNLCRCTGYFPIRRAAQMVTGAKAKDEFSEKLERANCESSSLRYANGEQIFYRPTRLAEVFDLLQEHTDAVLVAGATDLGLEFS